MKKPDTLVVIHLTATAIHTVIGQVYSASDIRIIGIGSVKSYDFYQGTIRHRERLKSAIKQSMQEAEDMSNCRINSVWLSFATPDLQSLNSVGEVAIHHDTIQAKDVVTALTQVKQQHVRDDMYLMHYTQQGIALDDDDQMINDAIGMQAKRMTVLYHLMMMPVRGRQNLQQLLQECDVKIDQILFDAVSSAEYCLLVDEKYHGVCLIDIGYASTSVCVYREHKLVYTHCFAEGGHDATLDISMLLDVTIAEAELIKKNQANVDRHGIDASAFFTVKRTQFDDEKAINMQQLHNIVHARYAKLLGDIKRSLDDAGLSDFLQQGYVLTGGGSDMRGLLPLAKQVFANKVHKANTNSAISPYAPFSDSDEKLRDLVTLIEQRKFQTAFGTLLYSQSEDFLHSEKASPDALKQPALQRHMQQMGNFLRRFF